MSNQKIKNNNGILELPMDPKYEPDPQGLGTHCFYKMKEFSDRIGQVDVATNKSETYGSILINSVRVALKIKSLGITDDDIGSICTGSHSQVCLPFWASLFIGLKLANLDPTISKNEIKYLANLTKPKIIFCDPDSVEKLEIVINELNLNTILVVFGETEKHIPFSECIKPQEGEENFKPKVAENMFDTVSMFFSSGTTGLPKAVCLHHYGILTTINILKDYYELSSVLFFTSPYWISYLLAMATILISGGQRILSSINEENFLHIVQDHKVSFLFLPPAVTYTITAISGNSNDFDTSTLRAMTIVGGSVGSEQIRRIRNLFHDCFVRPMYGLSEISGMFSAFSRKYEENTSDDNATSCGRMFPDTICKIVDIDTNEVLDGPNKSGELLIKTKRMMNGYYNDPKKTAEAFDEDGFFRTGDVVYYDEDYCFYIIDRIKEMFKYKYWQIAPAELENILIKHPAVKEVLVIGYPNEQDNDHPMAVIVPHNGANVSENDILEYFNEQVIDRKRLRGGVKFTTQLPRTITGKYSRKKLRDMVINNEI